MTATQVLCARIKLKMADAAGAPADQRRSSVEQHLRDLVAKYSVSDKQRQALHSALLADVGSADAWARVLRFEVGAPLYTAGQ